MQMEMFRFNDFNAFILELCWIFGEFSIEWHVTEQGTSNGNASDMDFEGTLFESWVGR